MTVPQVPPPALGPATSIGEASLVSVLLSYAVLPDRGCCAAADQGTTHRQLASCHTQQLIDPAHKGCEFGHVED